jgi:NAD(P)-dependent dehydrogenase (short-subunit alcohol dehydrogenase family)
MVDQLRPVWFITGCSAGFGNALAEAVLARGWNAVVTARDTSKVAVLAERHPKTAIAVQLDVTDRDQIHAAIAAAREKFGTIDVLVNNAGYGYQSSIEEGEEEKIRAQFDANVFGLFAVTRAVLPLMRAAGRGHIMNITSVAGYIGFAGSGYYAASKHAVEGFSDALAAEVNPLGIHVTCIAPGPFRTDWAGRSLIQTKGAISDYAATAYARMQSTTEKTGTQAGDPLRAAEAMIAVTETDKPPKRIVLGAFGLDVVPRKLNAALEEIDEWRKIGLQTDFPAP